MTCLREWKDRYKYRHYVDDVFVNEYTACDMRWPVNGDARFQWTSALADVTCPQCQGALENFGQMFYCREGGCTVHMPDRDLLDLHRYSH